MTAFQHVTAPWLKWSHYFRAGNKQVCEVCFFFFLCLQLTEEMRVALWAMCGQAWQVWAAGLCMSLCIWLCWCVQVLELGRRAQGEDQRLQLARFYSSDDGCFHSLHTMASIYHLPLNTSVLFSSHLDTRAHRSMLPWRSLHLDTFFWTQWWRMT